ncbi:MAG: VIT1/CCC1 transporter family protein, partial [Bacteroidales bacterium]|nr:VIT1/CCC1 transporter family protein [Bacteroidales bacterium]
VAKQLTAHNALEAHARDELGLNEISRAKPLQAAFASATSFIVGGIFPLLISIFAPLKQMIYFQYGFSILFLALSGTLAAKVGGSSVSQSVCRICIWGTIAMVMSALIGYLFGVSIN